MNNENNLGWRDSLPIIENVILDFGIYDIVAKLEREYVDTHIYRARIEKDSFVDFGEHDNEKLLLVLQGSCVINERLLEAGNHLYIPEKFPHTLTTDTGLELLIVKFNVRR